jgi:gamma-D-glutamyl-L-lysine dipeptidyl-peptidase
VTTHCVCVEVATGWTGPDAPRDLDAPALADVPDLAGWTASMSAADRLGLHGRTVTQFLEGEPVEVVEERGAWVQVVGPWQPAAEDPRGYPAWVRRAHLVSAFDEPGGKREPGDVPEPADWRGDATGSSAHSAPAARGVTRDRQAVVGFARRFLGLAYLWGGTSPYGFDCSGLVHYCYRQAGVVVPRDAHAQQAAATPVALGTERPGDLYFFAENAGPATHVGFVTAQSSMLHAPESGRRIEDAPLTPDRAAALVGAGRFLT